MDAFCYSASLAEPQLSQQPHKIKLLIKPIFLVWGHRHLGMMHPQAP
jgi:hypothetical protein